MANQFINEGKKILERFVESGELCGATFGFVTKDEYECDFVGYKSLVPEKSENNINTLYDLASLSKVVSTTVLALKLIEDGYISLHTKISSILPDFPYDDITVRHLMTHTSGLPADDKNYKRCRDKEDMWKFIKKLKLNHEPGTYVEYSCFGYIVLGRIIEHFKGDLDKCAEEEIFKPLGMNNTMYNPKEKGRENDCAPTEVTKERGCIKGEVHDGKAHIMGGVAGNAGVFSDIKDVCRFVAMILNDGQLTGSRILKASTVDLLGKNYTEILNSNRTLGWLFADDVTNAGDYASDVSLFHTGFTGSAIYIDFIRECGIIILDNAVHPTRDNPKKEEIRNLFFNQVLLKYDEEMTK